jgi:hypothetical protein
MKIQNKIHSFFNRSKASNLTENTYTPNTERKPLRIAKTVQPDEQASFNEVFINARKELMK